MDNFKIIYKILRALEAAMDYEEFNMEQISPNILGISEPRCEAIMQMLLNNGYIEGGKIVALLGTPPKITWGRPQITLAGLEYLNENSMMKKLANAAKGIVDLVL